MFRAGGIARSSKAHIPPRAVRIDSRTLKLPTFSARKPAKGGVKMNSIGMTALMTATSWMLKIDKSSSSK